MKNRLPIKALFIDIGGVLLTDGWGHVSRERAARTFRLDLTELNIRHHLSVEVFEKGKISLKQYLQQVVFYEERTFTQKQFQKFMFEQSQSIPRMIELISKLKAQFGLKIAVISNESLEINLHRIQKFKLNGFVDFFVSSCFVNMRKPDPEMYRLATNLAQVPVEQIAYIDDRVMFVEIAQAEGIMGFQHIDYETTCKQLADLGLELTDAIND